MIRFGTDGIRGVAVSELTPALCLELGRAVATVFPDRDVVIGRDPRRSGSVLEAALAAGAGAQGARVRLVGVVPTPALAWIAREDDAIGMMVTASHNPWPDNGVKVFGPGGVKLDDATQTRIEELLGTSRAFERHGDGVGVIEADTGAADRYRHWVTNLSANSALSGLRMVVDAANGAMAAFAPAVLRAMGAEVIAVGLGDEGLDINEGCGATHPSTAAAAVVAHGADLGVCFDGDGDRLIALDAQGGVVDGDRLLALFALDRAQQGRLEGSGVAVTVMTNLGFHHAMARAGIPVATTPVGDRHIADALESRRWVLGGEQSGHVIQRDLSPTGDGLLAAVTLADLLRRSGRALGDLAREVMEAVPQVLVNVRLDPGVDTARLLDALSGPLADVERELGSEGRVLVRASGTEPLVRIMVEAPGADRAESLAKDLATALETLASA